MVRKCRPNGLDAWRRLNDRFDPPTVHHKAAMIIKLNNPARTKKLGDIGRSIEEWEDLLQRYTLQEKESMPNNMEKGRTNEDCAWRS